MLPLQMKNIWVVFYLIFPVSLDKICKKLDKYCSCDQTCSEYGDCCPGYKGLKEVGLLHNISTCKSFSNIRGTKFWMIDKCANDNHHLSNYCNKTQMNPNMILKSLIPVISGDSRIYENMYCAECNGQMEYIFANVSIECKDYTGFDIRKTNELILKNSKSCKILPQFEENKLRFCFPNFIRRCPDIQKEKMPDFEDGCRKGKTILVSDGKRFYKNDHCCKCWNMTCFNAYGYANTPYKFSYILNFNEWEEDEKKVLELKGKSTTHIANISDSNVVNNLVFYTSFIFTCISLLSLSLLMFLYATQKIFHNFGGYLTICLCSCLWLMNFISLLVSNPMITQSPICRYLGILQHFVALCTFIWMALYALDLLQTFGFKTTGIKKKNWKTFVVYCVFGFCCAAGFVGASTIVDFTMGNNSTIRPRYGGTHCWFTNKIGGIVWYFVPVCILLFWNFGTCVIVFFRLMKTAKDSRIAQQKESNSTLWLCIRLTAVFRIGYVFQIIVILSNREGLILFGSIINCLQGVLLTVCFGFTKRVHSAMLKTISSMTDTISKSFPQQQTSNNLIEPNRNQMEEKVW